MIFGTFNQKKRINNLLAMLDPVHTEYLCTNESIQSILYTMKPTPSDYFLSIMGSGQQGLSIAAKGARIDLIDNDLNQINNFSKLQEFLANKKNSNVSCQRILNELTVGWSAQQYFSEMNNIVNIRKNISNLKVLPPSNIQDLKTDFSKYNKVYLSNALNYRGIDNATARNSFNIFSSQFNPGTMFYVSKEFISSADKNEQFYVDPNLTNLARRISNSQVQGWSPQIIIKK